MGTGPSRCHRSQCRRENTGPRLIQSVRTLTCEGGYKSRELGALQSSKHYLPESSISSSSTEKGECMCQPCDDKSKIESVPSKTPSILQRATDHGTGTTASSYSVNNIRPPYPARAEPHRDDLFATFPEGYGFQHFSQTAYPGYYSGPSPYAPPPFPYGQMSFPYAQPPYAQPPYAHQPFPNAPSPSPVPYAPPPFPYGPEAADVFAPAEASDGPAADAESVAGDPEGCCPAPQERPQGEARVSQRRKRSCCLATCLWRRRSGRR